MPSFPHEIPLEMCRWKAALMPELLRGRAPLPEGKMIAREASADLSQTVPTEYRADHVVTFHHPDRPNGDPIFVVIVESQIDVRKRKHFVWPAYVGVAHSKWNCDVALLVLTQEREVAKWAKGPFGPTGMRLHPVVLCLSDLPQRISPSEALRMPELAVMIALGHKTFETAKAAIGVLDRMPSERAGLCYDAIMLELPDAARKKLGEQMLLDGYNFKSEFMVHHLSKAMRDGRKEGMKKGKAAGMKKGKLKGIKEGKRAGIKEGKAQGARAVLRKSVSSLRRVALELLRAKLPEGAKTEGAAISKLNDAGKLTELIVGLGCASNRTQARAALRKVVAA